jgi:hypothetical protein
MPPKSVKKTNPPTEVVTPVTPVVETQPVLVQSTPVVQVEAAITQTPEPVKQKGGKKQTKSSEPVVESTQTPVVAAVETTTTGTAPKVTKAGKKGGAKSAQVLTTGVEVSATPSTDAIPVVKKRGAKSSKASVEGAQVTEQTGGKAKAVKKVAVKAKAPKKSKEVVPGEVGVVGDTDAEESSDRLIRSFKVKLPDKEEFEGRFTGLTPYQAANKALSKYFRETEHPKQEITFLICESTRKSKKSVYTYVGKRYQLEVPVKYTIQDGREIVKNFKNSLKKVKKVDLLEKAGGATVVAPVVSTPVVATA